MERQSIEEKATAFRREPVHSRFIAGAPHMSTLQDHNVSWKNVPTRTITAGGVEFAYREVGQDNPGTPVVFLVHLAAVMDNWDPRVVDGFAAKHRVVVFDNRGVGASSGSPANSMEQMAEDAITFIKAMGFEQVDLFGFSMGGMIAQEIALMEPQLVRKMIIAGTGPAGGEGISKVARVTYLDMARGFLTRQDPKQFLFFTSLKVTLVPEAAQETRLPFGACPGSRNVLINSPSPHTVMPEKRLYHSPSGTSGSESSHAASNSSCVAGIFRL